MSEPTTPPAAWIADLPEDLRTNPTLSSFKGTEWKEVGPALAKSYVEARSMIGKKAYDLPADDWKPEQWANWHKTIGVPDAPDKYTPVDADLAEKAGLSGDVLKAAFAKFHEAGLTPRQKKILLDDWFVADAIKGSEMKAAQEKAASEKALGEMKAAYGEKFDAKMALVKSVLKLGEGDLAERLEAAGFGNDPQLFKALVALGEKTMEDSASRGGKGDSILGPEAQKADALRQIESITKERIANPALDSKYGDPRTDEFKKLQELFRKAYTINAA